MTRYLLLGGTHAGLVIDVPDDRHTWVMPLDDWPLGRKLLRRRAPACAHCDGRLVEIADARFADARRRTVIVHSTIGCPGVELQWLLTGEMFVMRSLRQDESAVSPLAGMSAAPEIEPDASAD